MIPSSLDINVGGDEASPVPVRITLGPRVFALGLAAITAALIWRKL